MVVESLYVNNNQCQVNLVINSHGAETVILWDNHANTMAADALAPRSPGYG